MYLRNASHITMVNGVGLALLGLKKGNSLRSAPLVLLPVGTALFGGIIFYEHLSNDKQFHSFIKFGGMGTITGWTLLAFV